MSNEITLNRYYFKINYEIVSIIIERETKYIQKRHHHLITKTENNLINKKYIL